MNDDHKQTLINVEPEAANLEAKIAQPKIRKLTVFVIIAVILGLVAAAEIVWLLGNK